MIQKSPYKYGSHYVFIITKMFCCILFVLIIKENESNAQNKDNFFPGVSPNTQKIVIELERLVSAPLDPKHIEEQANEFQQIINKADDPEIKSYYYSRFALRVSSTKLLGDQPDFVYHILESGLKYSTDIDSRLSMYNQMGYSIRLKNYRASGEDLRIHRLEAGKLFFKGLAEGQNKIIELRKKYERYVKDLDRLDEVDKIVLPIIGNPKTPKEDMKKYSGLIKESIKYGNMSRDNKDFYEAKRSRDQEMRLNSHIDSLVSNVADIYSRMPSDFNELESLCSQYLGNTDLSKKILDSTHVQYQRKVKLKYQYDNLSKNVISAANISDRPEKANNTKVAEKKPAAKMNPVAHQEIPEKEKSWNILYLVSIIMPLGICIALIIQYRRRKALH